MQLMETKNMMLSGLWLVHDFSKASIMAAATKMKNSTGTLSNYAGFQSLIVFAVLALAWLAGFSARLFAVIRFESIIHEFDPWYDHMWFHSINFYLLNLV